MKKLMVAFAAVLAAGFSLIALADVSLADVSDKAISRNGVTAVVDSILNNDNQYGGQKLLDDNASDSSRWIAKGTTATIVFTFPDAVVVNAYGVQAASYAGDSRAPKKWEFEASEDGVTWLSPALDSRSDITKWSATELRVFEFTNTTAYRYYRIRMTATNGGDKLSLGNFYFYDMTPDARVFIESTTVAAGPVEPTWGESAAKVGGSVTFKAFEGEWKSDLGNEKATCGGYTLYQLKDGEWDVLKSGSTMTVTLETVPEADVKMTWDIAYSAKVSVLSVSGGTATFPTDWIAYGENATLEASADKGYQFLGWYDCGGKSVSTENPWTVPCTCAMRIVPLFVKDGQSVRFVAEDGDNAKDGTSPENAMASIGAAVAALGDAGGLVCVAKGTYVVTEQISIAAPVGVLGTGMTPDDVIVKRTSGNTRIFNLDHANALVKNMTIRDGYGQSNVEPVTGGNVKISANGGVVEDCVILNGSVNTYNSSGGNVQMAGGRLSRCVIKNGYSSTGYGAAGGGAVYASGTAVVEDCLISGNKCGNYSDNAKNSVGGVRATGSARFANCTFIGNGAAGCAYGACYADGSSQIVNCAFYGNIARTDDAHPDNATFGGSAERYDTCAADTANAYNETCVPGLNAKDFVSYPDDLTPMSGGKLVNAGNESVVLVSETDLAGDPRRSGRIDIGCYEASQASLIVIGAPENYGEAIPAYGLHPGLSGALTATATDELTTEDGRTRVKCIGWTLYSIDESGTETEVDAGEGNVAKTTVPAGAAKLVWSFAREFKVTIEPSAGLGAVVCDNWIREGVSFTPTVIPESGWEFLAWIGDVDPDETKQATLVSTRPRNIAATFLPEGVSSPVQYVKADGNDASNGWFAVSAKKSIASAVDTIAKYGSLGGTVYVASGTYTSTDCVNVNVGVRILGETGDPADVILTKGDGAFRHFLINHPEALVANMTIEKGYVQQDQGANVKIGESGGVISNCVMRQGRVYNYYGGALGIATLSKDALVTHCVIRDNSSVDQDHEGAGAIAVLLKPGRMENSLVCQNASRKAKVGYAVVAVKKGGSVVKCTVADNETTVGVGIDSDKDSLVKNCVMYNNTNTTNADAVRVAAPWGGTAAAFDHCATDGAVSISSTCYANLTAAAFKKYEQCNYTPKSGGALTDKGVTPEGWKGITDLAGKPRVIGKAVDIGCYEGNSAGLILNIR